MNFWTCAFPPRIIFKKRAYVHFLICYFISSDWYIGICYSSGRSCGRYVPISSRRNQGNCGCLPNTQSFIFSWQRPSPFSTATCITTTVISCKARAEAGWHAHWSRVQHKKQDVSILLPFFFILFHTTFLYICVQAFQSIFAGTYNHCGSFSLTKLSYRSFFTGITIYKLLEDHTLGEERILSGPPEGSKINHCNWWVFFGNDCDRAFSIILWRFDETCTGYGYILVRVHCVYWHLVSLNNWFSICCRSPDGRHLAFCIREADQVQNSFLPCSHYAVLHRNHSQSQISLERDKRA